VIIKTTIVINTEFDGDDAAEFRALPEPVQDEILDRNLEQVVDLIRENFPESSRIDASIEEVEPE
jgi:hypothetical protein